MQLSFTGHAVWVPSAHPLGELAMSDCERQGAIPFAEWVIGDPPRSKYGRLLLSEFHIVFHVVKSGYVVILISFVVMSFSGVPALTKSSVMLPPLDD